MDTIKKITLFWICFPALHASSLFLPDSDTAALISLVSNTASTVSNTLKILEVAKKTSQKIDKYNAIAMRRFFIARRIEHHVRDILAAKKMRPKGLKEINRVMLRLKTNLQNLKSNLDLLAQDVVAAQDFMERHSEKMATALRDEQEMNQQEINSAGEGEVSKHVQNTAMNTALTGKILSQMRRDQLDYQQTDLQLKKGEKLEKLRREAIYREWLNLHTEPFEGVQL